MEIKEIKQRKTSSLDNEYSIRLITDDRNIMSLCEIKSDELVEVNIEKLQENNRI